jgi:nucleoside triphosphate pyrophosphatase
MLSQKFKDRNIILASGSPRRQQFLKDLDLEFTIRLKELEEKYPPDLKETEITDFLAKLKAEPFINDLKNKDLLITADTIVWLDDNAIEKPKNKHEAFEMLLKLSGRTHKVISSICITTISKQSIINDSTLVTFKDLCHDEINYYIHNYKPFDKAGSYGIQEWIGFIGIEKIEGSFFNVMGFPVHKFYQEMMKFI